MSNHCFEMNIVNPNCGGVTFEEMRKYPGIYRHESYKPDACRFYSYRGRVIGMEKGGEMFELIPQLTEEFCSSFNRYYKLEEEMYLEFVPASVVPPDTNVVPFGYDRAEEVWVESGKRPGPRELKNFLTPGEQAYVQMVWSAMDGSSSFMTAFLHILNTEKAKKEQAELAS